MKRVVGLLFFAACGGPAAPQVAPAAKVPAAPDAPSQNAVVVESPKVANRLDRPTFNREAIALGYPIYWRADDNHDGVLDPGELEVFWGLHDHATLATYVEKGSFQSAFWNAYGAITRGTSFWISAGGTPQERTRRELLTKELSQSRQTLVLTDMSSAKAADKAFVGHLASAASRIERLYAKQMGVDGVAIADDPLSRAVLFRNQSAACIAPATQDNPLCRANRDSGSQKRSGLYPTEWSGRTGFCEELAKNSDKSLMDPFTAVRQANGKLVAVSYPSAWPEDMKAIATDLTAAARSLEGEPALVAYLEKSAKAFADNQWWPADEAWAAMNAQNSKYYLRVGPDEVYGEPCSTKALFHVSFGLINQASLALQKKLDPLKTAMEQDIAKVAGAPYKARAVSFKLPDFVDIALNAGDSRPPSGATIGQSLPNFGPVANEGRGRTVVMTNFYTDPDSLAAQRSTAESLFCKSTQKSFTSDPKPQLMSTILHEAAHNLGPSHQYKVGGKIDREVFGGPLASTLEELKAQTSAMYLVEWLVSRKEWTREDADLAHVRDVFWAMGHISRGMYDESHHPHNYSQLAAIQVGTFLREGSIVWKSDDVAANGTDKGCYEIDLKKMPTAVSTLMSGIAKIKGAGDKKKAEEWMAAYVDTTGEPSVHWQRIRERVLREAKPSFVYSLRLK